VIMREVGGGPELTAIKALAVDEVADGGW